MIIVAWRSAVGLGADGAWFETRPEAEGEEQTPQAAAIERGRTSKGITHVRDVALCGPMAACIFGGAV